MDFNDYADMLTEQILREINRSGMYKLYIGQREKDYDFLLNLGNNNNISVIKLNGWVTLRA